MNFPNNEIFIFIEKNLSFIKRKIELSNYSFFLKKNIISFIKKNLSFILIYNEFSKNSNFYFY
jgi:hypothetical protein